VTASASGTADVRIEDKEEEEYVAVDDGSTTGSAEETMPFDDGSGDAPAAAPAAADAAATQRSREADDRAAAAHMRHPRNRSGLGAHIVFVLFVDVVVATIFPMLACLPSCLPACLLACLLACC
jgi:pantoate kinase